MAQLRSKKFRFAAITSLATAALVGGFTALPAQAAPAEGKVLAAGSPTAIKDSYIVTLKKGSAGFKASSSAGKSLVKEYGGTVKKTFGTVLNGYTATLSATEAKRLAADPAVASVEQNQTFELADTTQSSAPWGLDRIDQAALPLSGTYTYPDTAGSGVTVYVIDTGVRITHTQISGRASYGYDAVDGDTSAGDGNGHGTHVATTIAGTTYGVAKKANIVAVRVLDNSGSGTTAGVIDGIEWVTENHTTPAVANMSLGGSASSSLDSAVAASIADGVTYAVAAGNSSANASSYSPARVASAITVGATTSADAKASYSNYGSTLDIFAPGSSIIAGYNTSDTATATLSGTSMATPHVAGAAAVYLAGHTSAAPATVASALVNGAISGVVTSAGTGSPNKLLKLVP
ncbi:S8 family peptidase [Streptomyces fulvoviolaceus]|uniref:S8 family peptidase n=1 Tax=Streptomyces fulvoviolaceus TaxID=285535 RepID=UPI0021BFC236|nr:S8 family peptidase [Streptomyces fulvoviolaceus]MCT9076756.1 S8 family peptidase [Streptomyces fulvoviolaceus]